MRRLALTALALVGLGCDDAAAPQDVPIPEVAWSGCVQVEGSRCQRIGERVILWVADDEPRWTWTLDGDAVEPEVSGVDGGLRFSFAEDVNEGVLALRWGGAEVFSLTLEPDPVRLDDFAFAPTVRAALGSGDPDTRREAADALLATPAADAREQLARVHHARRLYYDASDPDASAPRVRPLLERQAELAGLAGAPGLRCLAAEVGLFLGTMHEDRVLVSRWRTLEEDCRVRSAGRGARIDHYLAIDARQHGAYDDAEDRLRRRAQVVRRVQPEEQVDVSKALVDLYVRTGRWSEAGRAIEALEAAEHSACTRAQVASWVGYARVRAWQNEAELGDPRPGLRAALAAHTQGACRHAGYATHDRVKLGYAAALRGDTEGLRTLLDTLAEAPIHGKYRLQVDELELELAVAEGRHADVARLAAAMQAGLDGAEPEARWRHQMLLARAAAARDDAAAEEAAYQRAEAVLDSLWSGTSSETLRARWLAVYRRSAVALMRVRLSRGAWQAAACTARVARRRALAQPGDEDPCGQPWARGSGEQVFLIVPEDDAYWQVLRIEDERVVEAHRVPAPAGDDDAWWDRWTPAIRRAQRVRVIASAQALDVPLHRLSWQGQPLIRQRPVVFGLDLGPSAVAPTTRATVVFSDADPLRALGRYAPQLEAVPAALERAGWTPRWLETPPVEALEASMPEGGLLLYFGHGVRTGARGDVGTTGVLLAEQARWGAEQVSGLSGVPRWAVLLGCDVALPDGRSWRGGLNLGHAMLLAGTEEVLAGSGSVDAPGAATLAAELFEAPQGASLRLSERLHRAWAQAAVDEASQAWGALRVWSR